MPDGGRVSGAPGRGQQGASLVEIVLVLLVVAGASTVLYAYLGATMESLDIMRAERPIHARLAADLATLAAVRTQMNVYYATHGHWPPSREAVRGLLSPAPRFQCAGNDYTYEPGSGAVGLLIMDPARC